MPKRIKNFQNFVLNEYRSNTVDESYIGQKFSEFKKWANGITNAIKDGIIKLIPSGLKKGVPIIGVFDPADGSIVSQIRKFYAGTEFVKTNPISVYESESIEEARLPLEYTGEDQTVRNIFAPELRSLVEKLYRSKERGGIARPIFIYGAPGIGKTEIVGQAAESLGVNLIVLDLQFTPMEDLAGIPSVQVIKDPKFSEEGALIDPGQGFTRSNPPRKLPPDNGPRGKGGIIFMDELNRCSSTKVFDAIMQFVQKGQLGDYHLPDRWVIVAAGNRPTDADVVSPDWAFSDRFRFVNFVPRLKDWKPWAEEAGYFPQEMLSFLDKNEELFHYIDSEKNEIAFPTPRSWTAAARILQDEMIEAGVDSWKELPIDTVYNVYYDQVGPVAASKLKAYLEVMRKVTEQDLEDIITNPEKAKLLAKGSNFSAVVYGLVGMAISKAEELSGGNAKTLNLYNIMEYFNRYGDLEILAWVYKQILDKYEEFEVAQDPAKIKAASEGDPDNMLRVKAKRMVLTGAQQKGLAPQKRDD
jgi:MoxR-like ATPase